MVVINCLHLVSFIQVIHKHITSFSEHDIICNNYSNYNNAKKIDSKI